VFILVELAGNPYIYGTLGGTNFCCDSDDFTATSAVDATISADGGDDVICLQDSTTGSCLDEVTGMQVWGAAATINGQNGEDEIYTCPSGSYADDIDGGNDGDFIKTYGGADEIWGGGGADTIHAGDGDDTVYGEEQADIIRGGSNDDVLEGGDHGDTIDGDADADVIRGGGDGDYLYGGTGADEMVGDGGVDYLGGNDGDDCLCGGSFGIGGTSNVDSSNDTMNGDGDTDDCYYVDDYPEVDVVSNCDGGGILSDECPCADPAP